MCKRQGWGKSIHVEEFLAKEQKETITQAECDDLYTIVDTFRHWARLIDWLLELCHDIETGKIGEDNTYFEGLEYTSTIESVRIFLKGE